MGTALVIGGHLGIANSGLSRLLQVLDAHGWVRKDLRALSSRCCHPPTYQQRCRCPVERVASERLAALATATQCTALLITRDGRALVHAAKHLHPHGMVMREVGSRVELA